MTTTGLAHWTIEMAAIPAGERTSRILSAFDSLSPGERVLLHAAAAPGDALSVLQAERPGLFEWSVVASGPDGWKIEVFRREAAPGSLREVTEALAWDHDRLDALEAAAFLALSHGDVPTAAARYAEFACGLERHIGFEEEVLFPVFEARAGLEPTFGPTAVMREEHAEIRYLLRSIGEAIGTGGDSIPLRRRFHEVIGEHNEKEEVILYPGTDRMLSPRESDELVGRIQRYGM